jgi:hypothetical protein
MTLRWCGAMQEEHVMDKTTRELTSDELDQVTGGDDTAQKIIIGGVLLTVVDKNTDLLAGAIKQVAGKYAH